MKRKNLIIILSIVAAVLVAGVIITVVVINSNKCEQHVYDDCADIECNVCGETRDSMHSWKAADCLNPKSCTVCGKTEGTAIGHTPADDDGDCTTEVKCTVCGEVTTAAKTDHIAHADDGDCTTPVTCTECTTVLTAAKEHDFEGAEWQSSEAQHWHVCQNDSCDVTDEKIDHTSDGAATEDKPEKCSVCQYTIAPQLPHACSYTVQNKDATHHWMECTCGEIDESTKVGHSATSDNDCTTDDKCTCGHTVTAATDHVAGEDDGNCTTPIGCINCDQTAVAGNTEHTDTDHDHSCNADGCQIMLPGAPVDDNEGIDLPIDRN